MRVACSDEDYWTGSRFQHWEDGFWFRKILIYDSDSCTATVKKVFWYSLWRWINRQVITLCWKIQRLFK